MRLIKWHTRRIILYTVRRAGRNRCHGGCRHRHIFHTRAIFHNKQEDRVQTWMVRGYPGKNLEHLEDLMELTEIMDIRGHAGTFTSLLERSGPRETLHLSRRMDFS